MVAVNRVIYLELIGVGRGWPVSRVKFSIWTFSRVHGSLFFQWFEDGEKTRKGERNAGKAMAFERVRRFSWLIPVWLHYQGTCQDLG